MNYRQHQANLLTNKNVESSLSWELHLRREEDSTGCITLKKYPLSVKGGYIRVRVQHHKERHGHRIIQMNGFPGTTRAPITNTIGTK